LFRLTLIWTASLFLFPLLLAQGIWTRRHIEKLPEARSPNEGIAGGKGRPIYIVGVGDSVIAGVGVEWLSESLTACVAGKLSSKMNRSVAWAAYGINGERVSELIKRVPQIPNKEVDQVLVSIGVNDVSRLTSISCWHFEIAALIAELKQHFGVPIIFMGLPPMGVFPGLPQPLRFVLGIRAAMLDLILVNATKQHDDILWSGSFSQMDFSNPAKILVASDGYHPNRQACEISSEEIAAQVIEANLHEAW